MQEEYRAYVEENFVGQEIIWGRGYMSPGGEEEVAAVIDGVEIEGKRVPVGIAETREGDWLVRYAQIDLGIIDPRTNHLIRFVPPRSGRHKAKQPKRLLPMYPV